MAVEPPIFICMISKGYFIKARCIKNSWIAHAPPIVREVWDYLLREANYKDVKYMGFTVKRGQLFRSYREIINGLEWRVGYRIQRYHESSMKRAMKALRTEGMIELVNEPRGNLITVVNYAEYQDPKNYERTNERTNDRTRCEPDANQRRTSIKKKEKKEKKEKKDTNTHTQYRVRTMCGEVLEKYPCVCVNDSEYLKLKKKLGEKTTHRYLGKLNNYIASIGDDKYKSHYHTILTWYDRAVDSGKEQDLDDAEEFIEVN